MAIRSLRPRWDRESLARALGTPRLIVLNALAITTLACVVGWILIIREVNSREITDIGLISVVPVGALALLAVLSAAFVAALRIRPAPRSLLCLQLACVVLMLYGAPPLFEDLPRFVTAWRHLGFVDVIERTGELYPNRDARFDWPGFFVLVAFLKGIVQPADLLAVLGWVPVVSMLLYLGPLFLIFRAAISDERVIWAGLWLFCLTNWVGQDYFSPQGFNLLLFLTLLAIVVTRFRRPADIGLWKFIRDRAPPAVVRWWSRVTIDESADGASLASPPRWREQIGLLAIIALLFGASVASHQLTPFALIGAVALLVVADRLILRGLPMLMVVLLVAWLIFMATTYLSGHLAGLVEDVGQTSEIAASNIAERIVGSEGHLLVVHARLGFSLAVWLLAAVGVLRRLVSGRLDLTLGLLAAAPFGLIALQPYGGEILLRVYFFSLPFMAFFAAVALFPTPRAASLGLSALLIATSVLLAVGLITTRYGNEKAELVTREDYVAMETLMNEAESGDWVILIGQSVPVEYRDFGKLRYRNAGYLLRRDALSTFVQGLPRAIPPEESVYFLVTRGQRSHAELYWGMSANDWDGRVEALAQQLEIVYRNNEAWVLRWRSANQ